MDGSGAPKAKGFAPVTAECGGPRDHGGATLGAWGQDAVEEIGVAQRWCDFEDDPTVIVPPPEATDHTRAAAAIRVSTPSLL